MTAPRGRTSTRWPTALLTAPIAVSLFAGATYFASQSGASAQLSTSSDQASSKVSGTTKSKTSTTQDSVPAPAQSAATSQVAPQTHTSTGASGSGR
ncbi:MAG: hypothetical protein WCP28_18420 [Actinomycetes bacterium]